MFHIYTTVFTNDEALIRPEDTLLLEVRHSGFSFRPYGNCTYDTFYAKGVYIECKIPTEEYETTNVIRLVQKRTLDNGTVVTSKYQSYVEAFNCLPEYRRREHKFTVLPTEQKSAMIEWKRETNSSEDVKKTKRKVLVDGKVIGHLHCPCPVKNTCPENTHEQNCSINIAGLRACTDHEVCIEGEQSKFMCTTFRLSCAPSASVIDVGKDGGMSSSHVFLTVTLILFVAVVIVMMFIGEKLSSSWFHRSAPHHLLCEEYV